MLLLSFCYMAWLVGASGPLSRIEDHAGIGRMRFATGLIFLSLASVILLLIARLTPGSAGDAFVILLFGVLGYLAATSVAARVLAAGHGFPMAMTSLALPGILPVLAFLRSSRPAVMAERTALDGRIGAIPFLMTLSLSVGIMASAVGHVMRLTMAETIVSGVRDAGGTASNAGHVVTLRLEGVAQDATDDPAFLGDACTSLRKPLEFGLAFRLLAGPDRVVVVDRTQCNRLASQSIGG